MKKDFLIFPILFVFFVSVYGEKKSNGLITVDFINIDSILPADSRGIIREHELRLPVFESKNKKIAESLKKLTDSLWISYLARVESNDSILSTNLNLSFEVIKFSSTEIVFKMSGAYSWPTMPRDASIDKIVCIELKKDHAYHNSDNCQENALTLEEHHQIALKYFKQGNIDSAIDELKNRIGDVWHADIHKVEIYNDYGFFLEQGKKYKEAIDVLNAVLFHAPERTVAYINLGDAYWGLKDKKNAKEAYKKYIELMKENGKEKKIPKRALNRISTVRD